MASGVAATIAAAASAVWAAGLLLIVSIVLGVMGLRRIHPSALRETVRDSRTEAILLLGALAVLSVMALEPPMLDQFRRPVAALFGFLAYSSLAVGSFKLAKALRQSLRAKSCDFL